MTTFQPRTVPTPPVSPVEVLTNRIGTALVRWSLRHAELRAARAVVGRERALRRAVGTGSPTLTSTNTDVVLAEVTRYR